MARPRRLSCRLASATQRVELALQRSKLRGQVGDAAGEKRYQARVSQAKLVRVRGVDDQVGVEPVFTQRTRHILCNETRMRLPMLLSAIRSLCNRMVAIDCPQAHRPQGTHGIQAATKWRDFGRVAAVSGRGPRYLQVRICQT